MSTADQSPAPAGTADAATAALTGRRRVAFATYVDGPRLPGFLALLRSLALSNPTVCEDYLVLHDGLPDAAVERIRALRPRTVLRPVDTERLLAHAGGDPARVARFAPLEAFRIREYGTLLVLDAELTVRGRLTRLLRLRDGLAAPSVPGGGGGADGVPALDGRLLVVQQDHLTDDFCARLDAEARTGTARDGADVLAAVLHARGGKPVQLDAIGAGSPLAPAQAEAEAADADGGADGDAAFHAEFLALPGAVHHDLLAHFGLPHVARTGDLATARRVAAAQIEAGEYQEAVDLLSALPVPLDDAWPHEVLGLALTSVSRYDEAQAHLLLATADPGRAASAFSRLAQLTWVRGEDAESRRYALAGLSVDPTHTPSRNALLRLDLDLPGTRGPEPVREGPARKQLAHVAFYMPMRGNAGDRVLPESVRLAFDPETGPRNWHSVHAHRLFDEAALRQVNARRGVVVGGGGLFLPDTAPNGNSAWQWNVPDDLLERITVPLAVYAVGFNTFDGQSYRQERFATAVRKLVEKSAFFGLRNHGSIAQVRRLLPPGLQDRVRYQPCPTTVTRHLVPGWRDPAEREDTVLLNAAYDRSGMRFGHDYGHFLAQLAEAVRRIGRHAEVRCAAHTPEDDRIAVDLRRDHGVSLPVIPMYDYGTAEILDVYARTRLVIGMRGHAGMIPFGCGTPIISLVSHPKMAYFLADVDRAEWGVSVHERHLADILTERAVAVLDDHPAAVADVLGRQDELWRVTRENAAELSRLF
ncbi:polysaccharide pyruvyl transferase family protein [Actinacidiphila yeochonensis]|uniref:polysaccharide pyruvyl transferase family protein n=1 Tax=Actinacidiphila yeochonensis TaxID=89050 RepID=UPI0005625AC0|nr:polysaccharide pyruvyl transferase family protein [Actinacidiphila yeochonensis]